MDISDNHAKRHSENEFSRKLLTLIDAGAGVIHVRTNEVLRAVTCIRKTIIADRGTYSEWDIVNGTRKFTSANYTDEALPGDNQSDIGAAFQEPLGIIRDKTLDENIRCFTYVNPHVFVENNPHMAQLMLMYNEFLPSSGACVIMVTPDAPLPDNAANNSILCLHFDPPGHTELRQSLDTLLDAAEDDYPEGINLEDDDRDLVCNIGAGMTRLQFETHVSLATCKATTEDKAESLEASVVAREVQIGKTEIVNSSDILELYESADIDSVGGMENLKEWIDKRKNCYSDEAREFGVEPPKGMVLVGPPGTGKSLAGKATSSVLGVPLVRLDFGRVFSSYVGSSEARVRTALRMVESMAPVVLFVDEIDKGLGGIAGGGGSDSGVSMRVLGSFLTWLNDTKAPVFTMVTANNIDGLPPELLRRGRFNAIFSTSLPSPREREDVFEIHLQKRGRTLDKFAKDDIRDLIRATDKYVPAEIESIVQDALVDAFSEGEELGIRHLMAAAEALVPMSKSFAEQIERMNAWATNNAIPASRTVVKAPAESAPANARRVSTRRRG